MEVELAIRDDGRGFDPDDVPPEHMGLGIMRERAESAGAQLGIVSQTGRGTQVTVVWPGGNLPGSCSGNDLRTLERQSSGIDDATHQQASGFRFESRRSSGGCG